MKKGRIIVIIGVLIVTTLLLCKKPNNLYITDKFDSPDKLIQAFDNNLLYTEKMNERNSTNLLNSMISLRKRLSESGIDFDKIHIKKIEELSDKRKEEILSDYKNRLKNVPKYHPEGEFIPISFEGVGRKNFYLYNDSSKPEITDCYDSNIKVDAVIIKENGSYVFDYFWMTTLEDHD